MSKTTAWIKAFRLRTLPLALSCIAMGSILAAANQAMKWDVFVLSLLTTVFLQVLSNLANDYGDAVSGVDGNQRKGPSRTIQDGLISKKEMLRAIVIVSFLSLVSGILLLFSALNMNYTFILFLFIGILGIIAAIKYTMGKNPYGYSGFGDLFVFIFFGIIGVLGTYYLHTKSFDASLILPALSCSFFAVAVLNVNNIRDIESDKRSGKISIPVRLGRQRAVWYHYLLLIFGILSSVLFVIVNFRGPLQLLFLVVLPLLIINARAVTLFKEAHLVDPYLKQMALTTLLFVATFGIGILLYSYA